MQKYGFQFNKTYNPNNFDYFRNYTKEQLMSLLIGIIDGDGSINNNNSEYSNQIVITAHKVWEEFYKELFKYLEIEWHCSKKENCNIISIRIYQRKYCLMLRRFILNNNLFYLQRKWNKIIEKPTKE